MYSQVIPRLETAALRRAAPRWRAPSHFLGSGTARRGDVLDRERRTACPAPARPDGRAQDCHASAVTTHAAANFRHSLDALRARVDVMKVLSTFTVGLSGAVVVQGLAEATTRADASIGLTCKIVLGLAALGAVLVVAFDGAVEPNYEYLDWQAWANSWTPDEQQTQLEREQEAVLRLNRDVYARVRTAAWATVGLAIVSAALAMIWLL